MVHSTTKDQTVINKYPDNQNYPNKENRSPSNITKQTSQDSLGKNRTTTTETPDIPVLDFKK